MKVICGAQSNGQVYLTQINKFFLLTKRFTIKKKRDDVDNDGKEKEYYFLTKMNK